MKNVAVIFAGGVGQRMNSKAKPKQFLEIHGKPIIVHTIEHFQKNNEIDAVCVVVVSDWVDYMLALVEKYHLTKTRWVIPGGRTALESQYKGLKTIAEEAGTEDTVVLIHDGVRPLINPELISDCISHVREHGSAVTVAPAIETIVQADKNNMIYSTVERSECFLARAPQCFYLKEIIDAHDRAMNEGVYNFVDSTSLMLHFGFKVHIVEGPAENIKVTNPADFYICRALLDAKENTQIYGL